MTTQALFLRRMVEFLQRAQVPYMLAGSMGSSFHGEPRATNDIDFVIAPEADALNRFLDSLGESFYVSREAAMDALAGSSMFNVIDMEMGWKADFIIRKTRPFSLTEFHRRCEAQVLGIDVFVASPEDVILSKLEWMKDRDSELHFRDAFGVAVIQGASLDRDYLTHWSHELSVDALLNRLFDELARFKRDR